MELVDLYKFCENGFYHVEGLGMVWMNVGHRGHPYLHQVVKATFDEAVRIHNAVDAMSRLYL